MKVMPARSWLPSWVRLSFAPIWKSPPRFAPDHAAYIASWLKALQDDKRLIFSAAAHAQRAADYLHGLQPAQEAEPPEAVLRAMEDSDDPLPDAVAAAWA